jgi:CheY-like chemotaxis protein
MDIRMPHMDGLEATRRLLSATPAFPGRILVLTTFDIDEYVFEALRAGASAEELAYADYLAGRGARAASDDPLSRLVASGVQLRKGSVTPAQMEQAVEIASAQGWRRPLLAWLGVLEKRAADAGDRETAARLRRRMDLISK